MTAPPPDAANGGVARPLAARIGLVLLNLLGPGLGVLRVGSLRAALLILAAPFALFAGASLLLRLLPDLDLGGFLAVTIVLLVLTLAYLVAAVLLTWRGSRVRRVPAPAHARWPVVLGVMVLGFVAWVVLTADRNALGYRTFYVPSVAMAPTLMPGDRLVARMRTPDSLHRGQVVLHGLGETISIKRIAGLPGDRIELRGGRVVLNGAVIAQTPTGPGTAVPHMSGSGMASREFEEQFPDESRPHRVFDSEQVAMLDDVPATIVPPGHVYLLGDNRDDSLDSRTPVTDGGIGPVPIDAIRGYALFHLWEGGSQPAGTRIND